MDRDGAVAAAGGNSSRAAIASATQKRKKPTPPKRRILKRHESGDPRKKGKACSWTPFNSCMYHALLSMENLIIKNNDFSHERNKNECLNV